MNAIKSAVYNAISIIKEPNKEFINLRKKTFENVISDYFIMLLSVAVLVGVVQFIIYVLNAVYLDIILHADVQYLRMINYSFGRVTSIIFIYIFAGVFILAIVSWILRIFVKIKYTELLKIIFYSLSPVLLLSWIPLPPYYLFVWSIVLFFIGVSANKGEVKIKKTSIEQRD